MSSKKNTGKRLLQKIEVVRDAGIVILLSIVGSKHTIYVSAFVYVI